MVCTRYLVPIKRRDPIGRHRGLGSEGIGCVNILGTCLNERYRLDAELGRGGMGRVYRAHDTLLDRDVAVKVLSATKLGTAGRAHLLREAQAAAKLNHPNIVSVHDAGEAQIPDPADPAGPAVPMPFIVMELVDGPSLHDRRPALGRGLYTTSDVSFCLPGFAPP